MENKEKNTKNNLLDFDRDIDRLAKKIDWIEDEEARRRYVINFCISKARS